MRVFLPSTPGRVAALRAAGEVPPAEEGYCLTAALRAAIGADLEDDEATEVVVTAAADASLLLLAEEDAGDRRVVVVVEADAEPVADAEHPGLVRLVSGVVWSRVDSLLADDRGDEEVVARARRHVATDVDQAVRMTDRVHLGWFSPAEPLDT